MKFIIPIDRVHHDEKGKNISAAVRIAANHLTPSAFLLRQIRRITGGTSTIATTAATIHTMFLRMRATRYSLNASL